jgi:hypothetical protein
MTARRDDLGRLTPEALAQLANLGLVKRAQRELAAGYRPDITIDADGRLCARFPDQVTTEFAPGAGLADARCSCGAALCRHRIAVVLQHADSAAAQEPAADTRAPPPPALPFAALTREHVQAQCSTAVWALVERELAAGLRVEVDCLPSADGRNQVHTARLPHATARYYAGADLAFARCDCTARQRCEHVALGALALIAAGEVGEARREVELGVVERRTLAQTFDTGAVRALLRALLAQGLAHGAAERAETAAALSAAAAASRTLGATWLSLCLDDLEQWLDAWQRRSARFALLDGVALLGELALRLGASASGSGRLSPRAVLGIGEPIESALDRLTLVSLGLRVSGDGNNRRASLAVVDTDTQTLLCLQKTWQQPADRRLDELALLDQQRIGGNLRLARLAVGSLVTTSARRRANGELKLGQSSAGKASVGAQNGDWSRLAPPLLLGSQAAYLRQQRHAPPRALAPRSVLPGFHVLRVQAVQELGFDPARQRLHAQLIDADEAPWMLERDHAAATPGALDAIAAVLQRADGAEAPLYVAGRVSRGAHGLRIEPWALSLGGVVVPDASPPTGALAALPLLAADEAADDPLRGFIAALDELLGSALREGLLRRSGLDVQLATLGAQARELGLDDCAVPLAALKQQVMDVQSGNGAALEAALDSVLALAGWSLLAQHAIADIDDDDAEHDNERDNDTDAMQGGDDAAV